MKLKGRSTLVASFAIAAMLLSGCATSSGTDDSSTKPATEPSLEFVGPNGEVPGLLSELQLSDEDVKKIKEGKYTAAFVWHTASEFVTAVEVGATEEFNELGIEVVSSTQANFDAATQANNLESVLALNPSVIVAIAVDPVSAAKTFQPAVDKGIEIVIMTTPPAGWTAGKEFTSIVTENLALAGKANAELLGEALGGKGEIAYMFHDADFWFTNQRDQSFKNWSNYLYPDMKIVAESGFTDETKTQEIAAALVAKNPNIKGIYVPWATAAQGVVAALRDLGRTDIKVVTNDLDTVLASDMLNDGSVVGLVGNNALGIGKGLAISAAYGLLGKPAPQLVASDPIAVQKANLDEAWMLDYGTAVPSSVK